MFFIMALKTRFGLSCSEVKQEKGQGLVEYALIILLVAMTVIVLLGLFGTQLGSTFSGIVSEVSALQ